MFEEATRAAEEHFSKASSGNQTAEATSNEPSKAESSQPEDISELNLPEVQI